VPSEYKDGWDPEPGTDVLEKRKIPFPWLGIEPRLLCFQPVAEALPPHPLYEHEISSQLPQKLATGTHSELS